MLLAENQRLLQRTVDESVCKRGELKVTVGKGKVMVFERTREKTTDFAKPKAGSWHRPYRWSPRAPPPGGGRNRAYKGKK